MTKIKVKVINGHQMNGPMIVELANSYILALNQGQVPNIESAWTNVCNFEQERAYKDALRFFSDQVKEKLRLSDACDDIGSSNLKEVLNLIKAEALSYLKNNFIGDYKSIEGFEKKLIIEIKQQSKIVAREFQHKVDEEINRCVAKLFSEDIETKVRRDEIKELGVLNSEIDHLMTCIQVKYANDSERVEQIFRKYV
jgi:hypothetical protein